MVRFGIFLILFNHYNIKLRQIQLMIKYVQDAFNKLEKNTLDNDFITL